MELLVIILVACCFGMYFGWRARQRRLEDVQMKLLANTPLPTEHEDFLADYLPYGALSAEEQHRFGVKFRHFLTSKRFHGINGLEVTDAMRMLVAAEACLMITNLDGGVYPGLGNIYLIEDEFVPKDNPVNEHTGLPMFDERTGEVWPAGPMVLSWRAIDEGETVVFHEFAHQLDQQDDGGFDGTPGLGEETSYREWERVMGEEYITLREAVTRGEETYIDEYAATSEAEFFAVLTEYYFSEPRELRDQHPELFKVLLSYYKIDPLKWNPEEDKPVAPGYDKV